MSCAAWYQLTHGPVLVYGPGVGTTILEDLPLSCTSGGLFDVTKEFSVDQKKPESLLQQRFHSSKKMLHTAADR